MPMPRAEIESMIREALPDAKIEVRALADDGDHWEAYVESPTFRGLSKVKQHQMVYAALKGRMGGDLHALALTTSAG
jgi:stress-induced morphogen